MNRIRMGAGILLLLASSWISAYISGVGGYGGPLPFAAVAGAGSFLGGMVFYSGVRGWRRYRPS
jgi:hypothetical protein